jgi:REP element-mobilizing transposase RayT
MSSAPKIFYMRRLPHYQPPGETYFITFRLAGSLPNHGILQMKEWRRRVRENVGAASNESERRIFLAELHSKYFDGFDNVLDRALDGPTWLRHPEIAAVVAEAIHYRDTKTYDLDAFCIMPNHVHMVVGVERSDTSLYKILQSLKAFTARKCNELLGREGDFWQHESYDHIIRDEAELDRTVRYVLNNPVEAGLCGEWQNWPWTYVKRDILEMDPMWAHSGPLN